MKLIELAYHRNGVSANGFYAIRFRDGRQTFLATVFEDAGNVAVVCLGLLPSDGVAFGRNSWRGDRYEPALREWIKSYEDSL